jgi:hypothetical protein
LILRLAHELLGQLGYPDDGSVLEPDGGVSQDVADVLAEVEALLVDRIGDDCLESSPADAEWGFMLSATAPLPIAGLASSSWMVRGNRVTPLEAAHGDRAGIGTIDVIGQASDWISILTGELNIGSAVRQGIVRYAVRPGQHTGMAAAIHVDEITRMLARQLMPRRELIRKGTSNVNTA